MKTHTRFAILVTALLIGAGLNAYFSSPDITLPRKNLVDFPRVIGNWTAISDQLIGGRSMEVLQVDDYIMRTYRNSAGDNIGLYIGYFKSQREGKGIHSPRQCLPGAGLMPVFAGVQTLTISGHNPPTVSINKYIMEKGTDRMLFLFWYHGRGRIYANEYLNKIYLIWDALTKKRTDGALVRVSSGISGNSDEDLREQISFINQFMPLLKDYIPD